MNYQNIADEINRDIKMGVYKQFEKLRNMLEKIAHNLVKSEYIKNYSLPLNELKILRENDYITAFEYNKRLGLYS